MSNRNWNTIIQFHLKFCLCVLGFFASACSVKFNNPDAGSASTTTSESTSSTNSSTTGCAYGYTSYTAVGSGTASAPYEIWCVDQLHAMSNASSSLNGTHFKLMVDIDLSGESYTPIGTNYAFAGIFDGNGKTVSNMSLDSLTYAGFFAFLGAGSWVKDLIIADPSITGSTYAGAIAGESYGRVERCASTGSGTDPHISTGTMVGGLVGREYYGQVTRSYSTLNVSGIYAGGLVGYSFSYTHISDSYSTGLVESTSAFGKAGGVVAECYQCYVSNSYATGDVSGETEAGGLVGMGTTPYITTSYATGSVTVNDDYAGGLIARVGGGVTIISSYATGDVTHSGAAKDELSYVGGLVGSATFGTIRDSYATGDVTGASAVAGLAIGSDVHNSFFTGDISANTDTNGGPYYLTTGIINNSFYYSGATFSNSGTGTFNTSGTAEATLSDFYDKTQAPLSSWDFQGTKADGYDDEWYEEAGDFPKVFRSVSVLPAADFTGDGTQDSPFQISTADELAIIAGNSRYMASYFELQNDIDMTTLGVAWNEFGSNWFWFNGVFDGNGFKIQNFTHSGTSGIGFIRYMGGGAYVHDLELENVSITTTSSSAAGLAAFNYGGWISNVAVTGDGTAADDIDAGSSISGGMVAVMRNGVIEDSYVDLDMDGTSSMGGLIGYVYQRVVIRRSYTSGTVDGSAQEVGGLVGEVRSVGTQLYIYDSYSTATVNGTTSVGGLVGRMEGNIENSYSTGSVTGTTSVGGLVGYSPSGDITNSFTTSDVVGNTATNDAVGAVVGAGSSGDYTDVYYDSAATLSNPGGGSFNVIAGMNGIDFSVQTSYFYDPSNPPMSSWDFTNIWTDNSGSSGYPTQ